MPLALRILIAVALGVFAALFFGTHVAPLGDIGLLVIRLLKALAGPLILFAVLDAFLQNDIPARKGARLVALSVLNALVAIAIGLSVAHVVHAGSLWKGQIGALLTQVATSSHSPSTTVNVAKQSGSLDPFANFASYVPDSLLDPFVHNNIVTIVLVAVLCGAALRRVRTRGNELSRAGVGTIANIVHTGMHMWMQVLEWVVYLVPFAVFGIVAKVVSQAGIGVFKILAPFLGTILLGLCIHALVYYPLLLRVLGGRSPITFLKAGADAIFTALSSGSSLATLPVTLRCLQEKMKVSSDSARLAACVGTNLNHDGIILYEASAAIFVTQAFGFHVGGSQQISIALAAVMAGIGIAGVPEAGLITLPLVLAAAKIPDAVVATIIPLLLPVDWIIGRFRAATNVMSDMTVAVLLDGKPVPLEISNSSTVSETK